ncbi:hypothetical protein XM38_017330 [Halomicronema hongdechloris C2206]|uniref:Uncharacterized protein n=1 Tax=Halomicronema hongdechloris C2206 TaxID=1641165 RepID=A0A1Z3HKK1_9CYAN|nr:hypothetical protein XM38_017330 [Halomicronema hongdechloris C2206]
MAWGVKITIRPSLVGALGRRFQRSGYSAWGRASPRMVDGGCHGSSGRGRNRSKAVHRFPAKGSQLAAGGDQGVGGLRPQGRRPLVMIVSRGPWGRGFCFPQHFRQVKQLRDPCSPAGRRRSGERRHRRTASLPAREPVWEAAAWAAASVRPALITMMGLVRATSRAADRRRSGHCRCSPCR